MPDKLVSETKVPESSNQAETPNNVELRSRGNVDDITALIQGESNAAAEEIVKRRADGDAELGDAPTKPLSNGADESGISAEDAAQLEADAGIQPGDEKAAPDPDEKKAKPTSFKELAEAAGIDIKELYELTIGFGDGQGVDQPVKLSDIKDAYQAGFDLDARELTLETARTEYENDQLIRNQAVDSLIATMGLTPDQIRFQTQRVAETQLREQHKLFQIVPELAKSPELRAQRHQEIVSLVKPYGISAAEIDSLADHRFYKFAMDAVKWKDLIAAASAESKRVRKTNKGKRAPVRKFDGKGKTKTEASALADKAKSTRMPGDQVAAISALLGE